MAILGGGFFKYFKISHMNAVGAIFVHTIKMKKSVSLIKQQVNLTNQNSEFISCTIQYDEKVEVINAVYKVFISNSIFFLEKIFIFAQKHILV